MIIHRKLHARAHGDKRLCDGLEMYHGWDALVLQDWINGDYVASIADEIYHSLG